MGSYYIYILTKKCYFMQFLGIYSYSMKSPFHILFCDYIVILYDKPHKMSTQNSTIHISIHFPLNKQIGRIH